MAKHTMTLAETVKAGYHGQRGGVRKFARQIDSLVSRTIISSWNPSATVYKFSDGSLLISSGRGTGHRLEIFTEEPQIVKDWRARRAEHRP